MYGIAKARKQEATSSSQSCPPMQVRVLVHTDVTKYLEFKGVDGSFVLSKGRVEKVPATDYEALRSPLLGLFEKRRLRSFLLCVHPSLHADHAPMLLCCLKELDGPWARRLRQPVLPVSCTGCPLRALLRCFDDDRDGLT